MTHDRQISLRLPEELVRLIELYRRSRIEQVGVPFSSSTAVRLLLWEALRKNGVIEDDMKK